MTVQETQPSPNPVSGSKGPAAHSRIYTIRVRLILAFILVVLLPTMVITAMLTISGTVGERQQVLSQLETVMSYKDTAIRTWLESLKTGVINAGMGEAVLTDVRQVLLTSPGSSDYAAAREAHNRLLARFKQQLQQNQQFEELYLMNLDGRVTLSTNTTQEGQVFNDQPYFHAGLQGIYANPPYFSTSLGKTIFIIVAPVMDENQNVIGLVAGKANPAPLDAIFREVTGLGETGQTYLISTNYSLLSGLRLNQMGTRVQNTGLAQVVENRGKVSGPFSNYQNTPVLGIYRWLPELQAVMAAEQSQEESNRATYANLAVNISVALASLLIAIMVSLGFTRNIALPIAELAETAEQITAGRLDLSAAEYNEDEIGALAKAFNAMTAQLRHLIGNLETRVSERTQELAKRTQYLEASTQVGQATASILDPEELLVKAVDYIRENFDLYYVGLFLLDEAQEWAVLRAGTGQAGEAMIARGHRLRIGGSSMIGWSIANAQARIALQAGEDPVRLATAELPETRSEAAIPLRSRGQVLGSISVQSQQPNAFDAVVIALLQNMADQVAVALDNARLYAQSQKALETERRLSGEISQAAWGQLLKMRGNLGFRSGPFGVFRAGNLWYPEMAQAMLEGQTVQAQGRREGVFPAQEQLGNGPAELASLEGLKPTLAIPIQVRGHVIGVLDTFKPGDGSGWTPQEVTLLETIVDQLGVALEGARLYQETQERAERERLVGEVTTRMRQTLDIEAVLQTAAREIYQALGLRDVTIRLRSEQEERQA